MTYPSQRALREEFAASNLLTESAVREAVESFAPLMVGRSAVEVTDRGLRLEYAGRSHETTFEDLASQWSGTPGDLNDENAVRERINLWHQGRPVSTEEARTRGVPILEWDDQSDEPSWRVAIARGSHLLTWVPLFNDLKPDIDAVWNRAIERSAPSTHYRRSFGDITVWTHQLHPGLSSSIVADPAWLKVQAAEEMWVVFTPNRHKPVLTCPQAEADRLQRTTRQPVHIVAAASVHTFRRR